MKKVNYFKLGRTLKHRGNDKWSKQIRAIEEDLEHRFEQDVRFNKGYATNDYILLYESSSGFEYLSGINGKEDPIELVYPSLMDLGIMGHCKNDCKICYQGQVTRPNMTLDDFKLIIDQSKDFINQVALGGKGDPNLHENFHEIVKYCRDNGIVPNYTTSGNSLTDEQVEITKQYFGAVAVSSYNKDFTYEALNKFIKAGVKTNIHFVVSTETYPSLIDLLDGKDIWEGRFELEKLNAVVLLLFKPQGKGKEHLDLCLTKHHIEQISDEIKLGHTGPCGLGLDSCFFCKIRQVREFTKNEKIFADTCEGTRMSCYVTPDMYFMPCSFGDQTEWGTKIQKKNIMDIWNFSSQILKFREMLRRDPNTCPYQL